MEEIQIFKTALSDNAQYLRIIEKTNTPHLTHGLNIFRALLEIVKCFKSESVFQVVDLIAFQQRMIMGV